MQTKTIFAGTASTICCCHGKHSVLRQVSRSSTAKKKVIFVFPYRTQFLSDDVELPFGRTAY